MAGEKLIYEGSRVRFSSKNPAGLIGFIDAKVSEEIVNRPLHVNPAFWIGETQNRVQNGYTDQELVSILDLLGPGGMPEAMKEFPLSPIVMQHSYVIWNRIFGAYERQRSPDDTNFAPIRGVSRAMPKDKEEYFRLATGSLDLLERNEKTLALSAYRDVVTDTCESLFQSDPDFTRLYQELGWTFMKSILGQLNLKVGVKS